MKTIIAGSRDIFDYDLVSRVIEEINWPITEVVSGRAKGVDQLGERWAKEHNIPITPFPAEWRIFRKAAGPIRNQKMADYGEALVAIMRPNSIGTADMLKKALAKPLKKISVYKLGIGLYVYG